VADDPDGLTALVIPIGTVMARRHSPWRTVGRDSPSAR
jgi:hypothetical protein